MLNIVSISFWINLISLILSFFMLVKSFRRNNLIAFIYWTTFILLVVGQAIHISLALQFTKQARYLFNYVSPQGHFLASLLLLYVVLIIFVLQSRFTTDITFLKKNSTEKYIFKKSGIVIYYMFLLGYFFVISFILIRMVGGINVWLFSGRPMASGATVLILSYGFVMFPLLIKIASNIKIIFMDLFLFIAGFLMVFSLSRISGLFFLFMLGIVIFYRSFSRPELSRKKIYIIVGLLLGAFLFFGYGTYKNIVSKTTDIQKVVTLAINNPELSLFSIDLNYRISVEGMSGFSAAMSNYLENYVSENKFFIGNFGISLLWSVFQFIPAFMRSWASDIIQFLRSTYWHTGSIVSSGIENFFVFFSFFGILIYPFVFFLFAYGTHAKICKDIEKGVSSRIDTNLLLMALIASFGLQIIRGSIDFLVQFTIAEMLILYISIFLFKLFNKIRVEE